MTLVVASVEYGGGDKSGVHTTHDNSDSSASYQLNLQSVLGKTKKSILIVEVGCEIK